MSWPQYRLPGDPIVPLRKDLLYSSRDNRPPSPRPLARLPPRLRPRLEVPKQQHQASTARRIVRYGSISPPPHQPTVQSSRRDERSVPLKTRSLGERGRDRTRIPLDQSPGHPRVVEEGRKKRRRSISPAVRASGIGSAMGKTVQQEASFSHLNPPLPWVIVEGEAARPPVNRKYKLPFGASRESRKAVREESSGMEASQGSEGQDTELDRGTEDSGGAGGARIGTGGGSVSMKDIAERLATPHPSTTSLPPLRGLGSTLELYISSPPSHQSAEKVTTTSSYGSPSSKPLASVEPPASQQDDNACLSLRERVIKSQQARKNVSTTCQRPVTSQPPPKLPPSAPNALVQLDPGHSAPAHLHPQLRTFLPFISLPPLHHPQPVHPFYAPNFSPYPSPEEPRLPFNFAPRQQHLDLNAPPTHAGGTPSTNTQSMNERTREAFTGLATPEHWPAGAAAGRGKQWEFESGLVGGGEIDWDDEDDEMVVEGEKPKPSKVDSEDGHDEERVEEEMDLCEEEKGGVEDGAEVRVRSGGGGSPRSPSPRAPTPLVTLPRPSGLLSALSTPLDPRPARQINQIVPNTLAHQSKEDLEPSPKKLDNSPAPNLLLPPVARLLDFTGVPTAPRAMLKRPSASLNSPATRRPPAAHLTTSATPRPLSNPPSSLPAKPPGALDAAESVFGCLGF